MNTLVIDFGTSRTAALVVSASQAWVVPDPMNGERFWLSCAHWDGHRVTVGAIAERRGSADPDGFATGLKRGLALDMPLLLSSRRVRPSELVAELFHTIRDRAQRTHGVVDRVVLTVPADVTVDDPRRVRLLAASESVGFVAVELLPEALAAVDAAGGFRAGEIVLVHDYGATFTATLVRIGADRHEILGFQSLVDAQPLGPAGFGLATPTADQTVACCRDLLNRVGLDRRDVGCVLPVGSLSRSFGLSGAIERMLGIGVRQVDDPEFAVVRGAVRWLQASGPRVVVGQPSTDRVVPLAFTIPGGSARLLHWFVAPDEPYREGAVLARIRLASGAIWDLTARTRGTLDRVLLGDGAAVRTGEWLGLTRA